MLTLYNYFRSGTSHRLRIALNIKGLDYEYVAVNLRSEEHLQPAFKALNPQGLLPALVNDDQVMIQSPAILEWLEEKHPAPALLPADLQGRARVRSLAAVVGCDIHPINNRRILEYLRRVLGCDEAAVMAWCATWIQSGFDSLETLLAADPHRGVYCFGNAPTLADVYLVPQVESARRFQVDLAPYPRILAVEQACLLLPAFASAGPSLQPDAV